MKVKLEFNNVESEKEEFIADLLYEIVDSVIAVFEEEKDKLE